MKLQILISLDEKGNVEVQSNAQDKIILIGLMELAKMNINHQVEKKSKIIVPEMVLTKAG